MELMTCKRIFLTAKKSEGLSSVTLEEYADDLDRFFKFLVGKQIFSVDEVGPSTAREYLIQLKSSGMRNISAHRHYRAIRAWANFLVADGVLEKTFLSNVAAPKIEKKQSRTFTAEELSKLLNFFSGTSFVEIRNRAILMTLFGTGVRSTELRRLNLLDINLSASLLIVQDGKGMKTRHVPIAHALRQELKKYVAARAEKLGAVATSIPWLFTSDSGGQLGKSGLIHVFEKAKAGLGLQGHKVSAHTMRHSFARHFIACGGDVFSLQKIMGHSDLATTRKYVSLDDNDLRRSFERNNPLDNCRWLL